MTRIFTDGAEMGDALFWSSSYLTTAKTSSPTPAYSEYCYYIAGAGWCYKLISAISEAYIRARMYFYSVTSDNLHAPLFRTGGDNMVWLSCDATGHITANWPSGILATSTETVNVSQWYLIEMYVKIADNPNGRVVIYLDGTKIIDFTGDTLYSARTTFDNIYFTSGQNTVALALDDLALNDTAGGSDDSYCGDGVIIKVTPNGNGTDQDWHGSDGDSTDNYLLVDEYPHDTDTTYTYHNGADSGTQDQYALSDYDGTDKTILRIYPEARIRKTAAAAHTVKLGTLASGGTDAMSAGMNLTTSYARYVGDEQTVNPVDSGAWEEADIDALEFVVEVG